MTPSTGPVSVQPAASHDAAMIVRYCQMLQRLAYTLTRDLPALGEFGARRIAAETGAGVEHTLESALTALGPLVEACRAARREYVAHQLAARGLTPASRGLRINLGAGEHPIESWLNIDMRSADLILDLTWGLPFADGSVAYAFSAHVLEHLYYPREALHVVQELHRVLEPGGVLRVVVPDIEKCIRAYATEDVDFFVDRRQTWTWWPTGDTPLESFLAYAGASAAPGDIAGHKFGYDFETLSKLLRRAGFTRIERSDYMQSRHEALRVDDRSLVAGATSQAGHYSLFVDATV